MREVSKDKLVIIVTHNFEQVEKYATRHIRVFDSAVEGDEMITPPAPVAPHNNNVQHKHKGKTRKIISDGTHLGGVRFRATPKLTIFMCILMLLSSLAVTFVTAQSGDITMLFDKNYIFSHIDGRVVVTRKDGAVITDSELKELAEKTGAEFFMHYDYLLDRKVIGDYEYAYDRDDIKVNVGRHPEADNEIMLYLPIKYQLEYGKDKLKKNDSGISELTEYTVTGVGYYYDNTKSPIVIFTKSGFEAATAVLYTKTQQRLHFICSTPDKLQPGDKSYNIALNNGVIISFLIPEGTYYLSDDITKNIGAEAGDKVSSYIFGSFNSNTGSGMDFYSGYYDDSDYIKFPLNDYRLISATELPGGSESSMASAHPGSNGAMIVISSSIIEDFMHSWYDVSYTQASLFYPSDRSAHKVTGELERLGYIAATSDTVDKGVAIEMILNIIIAVFSTFAWLIAMVFIAMFMTLCSTRAMMATSGDIAIMRSMGIPVSVIKASVYAQTIISIIPGFILTGIALAVVFLIPQTNPYFTYLHAWQYAVIAAGLLIISIRMSRKYIKKMLSGSVKKTLKGGEAHD